jgi:uncharacterized protein (DUF433 family)
MMGVEAIMVPKLPLEANSLPIRVDHASGGALRVGSTRVTVETVLGTFRTGVSPEEIVHRYPALELADVYGVIAHYLRHRPAFDQYLDECERQAEQLRAEAIANGQAGLKDKLLARLASRKADDAALPH